MVLFIFNSFFILVFHIIHKINVRSHPFTQGNYEKSLYGTMYFTVPLIFVGLCVHEHMSEEQMLTLVTESTIAESSADPDV